MLKSLKILGGPFTKADEVNEFLKNNSIIDKEKTKNKERNEICKGHFHNTSENWYFVPNVNVITKQEAKKH